MTRLRYVLWIGLAVLGVGLLSWRRGTGARELRYYAPDEYVARADDFIRRGYLAADCAADPMRLVPRLDQAPPYERSWYEDSYLSTDVDRFNSEPDGYGWTFVVDNDCRLRGVNPVVHAIELPFAHRIRWLGNLLYSGEGSDALLRSSRRTVTLRRKDKPVRADEQATTRVGKAEDLSKEGSVLFHFAGGRGQPGARVFHVGDEVVVHNRVRAQSSEAVRLMGFQLPVGMLSRLETGDWLHLAAGAPAPVEETFVFVGGETLEVASHVRRQNERYQRETEDPGLGLITDPVRETTFPFLDQVAKSLDTVLAVLPEARADELSAGFDLQLTLQRGLQLRLSKVFGEFCDRVRKQQNLGEPFAAGLTVMDAATGDLLALVTWPQAEDLEGVELDGLARRRLLRNQSFVRHPIGSAGKPFFFAAIADAYPELRTLELDEHPGERHHREIFHCEIPTGYHLLDGHYGTIDFATALEISCNKYTVELATLALAADAGRPGGPLRDLVLRAKDAGGRAVDWPPEGRVSGVRIEGERLGWAPDLGTYFLAEPGEPQEDDSTAAVRCVSIDRFDQARYRGALATLTGAATYRGRVPQGLPDDATRRQLERSYTTNRYDLDLWRPLLEHLLAGADEEQAWKVRAALQEISPDRVNLAFNQVSRIRGDYLSLLLGGGTSVWTNVQLAEAMSRLVTGRAVEGRLVSRILPREDPAVDVEAAGAAPTTSTERSVPLSLGIDPYARRAVLAGTERVVEGPRGTAKALRGALDGLRRAFPQDRIRIFSKTGSPVVERIVPGVTATALERLVARGRLRLEGRGLVVRVGDRTTTYQPSGHARRSDYLNALQAALAEVGYPRHRRLLLVVRNLVDDFVKDWRTRGVDPAAIDGPFGIERGRLGLNRDDGVFRGRIARGLGSAYLLTVVRSPTAWTDTPPADARLLSVVLYLDVGPDSSTAVEAASAVLPELESVLR